MADELGPNEVPERIKRSRKEPGLSKDHLPLGGTNFPSPSRMGGQPVHSNISCPGCGASGRLTYEGDDQICLSCNWSSADYRRSKVTAMDRVWAELAGHSSKGIGRRLT